MFCYLALPLFGSRNHQPPNSMHLLSRYRTPHSSRGLSESRGLESRYCRKRSRKAEFAFPWRRTYQQLQLAHHGGRWVAEIPPWTIELSSRFLFEVKILTRISLRVHIIDSSQNHNVVASIATPFAVCDSDDRLRIVSKSIELTVTNTALLHRFVTHRAINLRWIHSYSTTHHTDLAWQASHQVHALGNKPQPW